MNERENRERQLADLAAKLHFKVEKRDSGFSLRRRVEGAEPVDREGLTLEEAEEFLNRWKLRGFHGG